MKKSLFCLAIGAMLFAGCMKHDFPDSGKVTKQQINENVKAVFGTEFDSNHDWSSTTNGEVVINNIPSGTEKVRLMAYVEESDTTKSLLTLNEAYIDGQTSVTLKYDAPNMCLGMYVAFIGDGKYEVKAVNNGSVLSRAMTRNTLTDYTLPSVTPTIGLAVESYASQRGWLPGQLLYEMSDYESQKMVAQDYSDEYKAIFRAIIFSYFKNGRQYNNLPLIKESGYFNAAVYPITTGKEPIVVSPVYKSDKAKQYGNEIWNSDLYYYYYKESDLEGKSDYEVYQFCCSNLHLCNYLILLDYHYIL